MTKISEIEQSFNDVFKEEDGKVQSVETVYELSEDEKFYKLVISVHGLSVEDTLIIHTKFIFKTDLEKRHIIDNSFLYLYDFIESHAMFLNYYMRRAKITDYSIFDVKYDPKFKTTPCDKTTFDFEVDVNNNYRFDISIFKIDRRSDDEENDTYKFQFKFMDEIETIETDSLKNIHFMIGSNIARILDKKLKQQ